ncbi:MAG: asparagine--tRNA ligase [Lentisphaerae bacterium]|nr:asparagine--tRNA ligase [Lentisphaerota bacterium]
MKRDLIADVLRRAEVGRTACVGGWVKTRRDSKGGFSFLAVNDGSSFHDLQVVAEATLPNYRDDVLKLTTGAAVTVGGELVASPGAGQRIELRAAEVTVHGYADPGAYPLQKKKISFERLRELAHLRPRTNTFGAVARVRSALAFATHAFFRERHFHYVHTPIITASDCEGAGEMFRVTTLDAGEAPRDAAGGVDYSRDFFGRPTFLTVSGQLEGEAYACGLGRIYTFGPTFRAENSNTRRHLAEFWMIEPEMAFADLDDNAALAEAYVRGLFRHVLEYCAPDLEFFNTRIDKTLLATLTHIADSPFRRLTYTEAVEVLERSGRRFDFPVGWGKDLQSEHERYLTEEAFQQPLIVTDFPEAIKPFYMRVNDDGRTVAAMDVLVPKVGEIIGGSQREERLDVLRDRLRAKGLSEQNYGWFLDLRRFGSVPHAGFGLGFERLVQFCTGMQNIRDVIPFPRTPGNAEF